MPIIPLKRILVLLYNLSDEWNIYLNTVHYTWITTGPYVLLIWSSNISQTHALLLLVRWRFTALSRKRVHLIKAWVLWNSVSFWWINSLTISLKTDLNEQLYKIINWIDHINVIFNIYVLQKLIASHSYLSVSAINAQMRGLNGNYKMLQYFTNLVSTRIPM